MSEPATPAGTAPSARSGDMADMSGLSRHDVAEYALLGLLREGPCHGYRLAAAFAPGGRLDPILRLKMSQMYAYLHKLERLGWVLSREETAGTTRHRRVFSLTVDGERTFDHWLGEPVAATRDIRLDFLLKLAFAVERDRAFAADLIARQHTATAARLERLRAQAAGGRDDSFSLRHLALDHHIHQTEATLGWLESLGGTLLPGS